MYLSKEIDDVLSVLNSAEELENIRFIKAYPYIKKGTIIKNKIATVSSGEIDLESISLDNDDFSGKYSVDIELFVPFSLGSPSALDDMERIFKVVMDSRVCGIKIHNLVKDSVAECYRLKASFYYCLDYEKE